jgi:hypothetical protein
MMRNCIAPCLGLFLSFAMPTFAETVQAALKTPGADPIAVVAQAQQERGLMVRRAGQPSSLLSSERFAALPRITQRVSFMTGNGEQQNEWTGPLLWTVLDASGLIEGSNQRERPISWCALPQRTVMLPQSQLERFPRSLPIGQFCSPTN